MRNFDQLSQDEQMKAVDDITELLITSTVNGYTPECFRSYQTLVDSIISISPPDLARDRLLQALDVKREMRVAMLHQAGQIAKASYYP